MLIVLHRDEREFFLEIVLGFAMFIWVLRPLQLVGRFSSTSGGADESEAGCRQDGLKAIPQW